MQHSTLHVVVACPVWRNSVMANVADDRLRQRGWQPVGGEWMRSGERASFNEALIVEARADIVRWLCVIGREQPETDLALFELVLRERGHLRLVEAAAA